MVRSMPWHCQQKSLDAVSATVRLAGLETPIDPPLSTVPQRGDRLALLAKRPFFMDNSGTVGEEIVGLSGTFRSGLSRWRSRVRVSSAPFAPAWDCMVYAIPGAFFPLSTARPCALRASVLDHRQVLTQWYRQLWLSPQPPTRHVVGRSSAARSSGHVSGVSAGS
jgi:hypothetical protein